MNASEIARLEEELRIKLPENYVARVRRLVRELAGLPGSLGYGANRPFMIGINEVLSINRKMREHPLSDWLDHMFVCGFERVGNDLYVIDSRQQEPRLLQITSTSKDPFPPSSSNLEPCSKFPDLAALYEYALEKYRRFGAKKGKKMPQSVPPAAPASAPAAKPRAGEAADPRTLKSLAKLLEEAGFELVKPRRKHSIALLTQDVIPALPKNLVALYTLCDGGRCRRLNLELLSLTQAVGMARAFSAAPEMGLYPMGYFPFVADKNAGSDPCCVATKGPLAGHVVHVHHDGPDALKAHTLEGFFRVLAKNLGNDDWRLEDADYEERPPEHVPFELAGDKRTPGDLQAARELLRLGEERLAATGQCLEYQHLFEIALMLFSSKQKKEIRALTKHRDREVRLIAEHRLSNQAARGQPRGA